jgi:hypothetical protein
MCVWLGNQQSCGVVTRRVQTDAVRSLHHQHRDLHQLNSLYLSEDQESSYYHRCPRAIGLYEWVVMTFGVKNVGATY